MGATLDLPSFGQKDRGIGKDAHVVKKPVMLDNEVQSTEGVAE